MEKEQKPTKTTDPAIAVEPVLCTVGLNPRQLYDYVKPYYEYYFKKYNGEDKFKKLSLAYIGGYVTINNDGYITKCRAIQFERYMHNLKSYCA